MEAADDRLFPERMMQLIIAQVVAALGPLVVRLMNNGLSTGGDRAVKLFARAR